MSTIARSLLFWIPRGLGLAFAAFLGVFALDVFDGRHALGPTLLALGMHLIPTGLVLLVLALVWRRPWIGALLFPALAVLHLWSKWGRLDLSGYLVIDGPLVLTGVLFALDQLARRAPRPA